VTDLAGVLWIGGGTGSGKSSIAITLAETYGLERYNYDWHDARDHTDRTRPDRHPIRSAFLAMSLDDQWVNRTPSQMVEAELADFAERFEMVLEDLAALPADRVVADGFGLLPELIASATPDRSQAIFLLPTPAFRDWALAQRGLARAGRHQQPGPCAGEPSRARRDADGPCSRARARAGLRDDRCRRHPDAGQPGRRCGVTLPSWPLIGQEAVALLARSCRAGTLAVPLP